MEGKDTLSKIKKYFFFISIVFLFVTWIHLSYIFIYNDSKEVAEKWWRVIEWIIWEVPHLNPLKTDNNYNDTINRMLYRSLLKYKIDKKEIEWDIANCDILTSSKIIECSINNNAIWSNWEKITFEDIFSTYKVLKETNINPSLKKILENIDIEKKESSFVFINNKKDKNWYIIEDINILNLLFQPIIPASIANNIKWDDALFSPIDWIYSWEYILSRIEEDKALWIKKYLLEKNELYKDNPIYINSYVFFIFNDMSHFLKNKNTVNIFKDDNNLIKSSVPKLAEHKYNLNKYSSLFINTLNIKNKDIRAIILWAIDYESLEKELWKDNIKIIKSPFLDEIELTTIDKNNDLNILLEKKWYYNKNDIIKKLSKNINSSLNQTYSNEVNINNKEVIKLEENEIINEENYLSKSKVIYEPNWVDNYNFITKDDILIKWNIVWDIEEVYINDYKLDWFNSWDKEFYYRLKSSYNTLKKWINEYNIYVIKKWEKNKELLETITFFYDDKENHKKYIENLITQLNKEKLEAKISKTEKINVWVENKDEKDKYKDLLKSFENLDSKFYYNEKLEAYSLNIYYIYENENNDKTANFIKNRLENIWIKITLKSLEIKEFLELLESSEKNYDMFIWNINLWYFNFNLFPYLHSSQIRNASKLNLSNFTTKETDIITEKLKNKLLSKEETKKTELELIKILKEESIMKPLYTTYYNVLIDKNIKWYEINNYIPYEKYLFDPFIKSFVEKKRIINYDNKNITNFFRYLIDILF